MNNNQKVGNRMEDIIPDTITTIPELVNKIMKTPQDESLELTVDLWNKFTEIENLHPSAKEEFCHHLHCIQNLLFAHKYKIEVQNNNMLKSIKY